MEPCFGMRDNLLRVVFSQQSILLENHYRLLLSFIDKERHRDETLLYIEREIKSPMRTAHGARRRRPL